MVGYLHPHTYRPTDPGLDLVNTVRHHSESRAPRLGAGLFKKSEDIDPSAAPWLAGGALAGGAVATAVPVGLAIRRGNRLLKGVESRRGILAAIEEEKRLGLGREHTRQYIRDLQSDLIKRALPSRGRLAAIGAGGAALGAGAAYGIHRFRNRDQ